jgi:hypothetical protein
MEEASCILTVVKLLNTIHHNYCSSTGHWLLSLIFSDPEPTTEQITKEIFYTPEKTGNKQDWNHAVSIPYLEAIHVNVSKDTPFRTCTTD